MTSSNLERNKIANIYFNELNNITNVYLPYQPSNVYSCFHLFVIHTSKRNALKKFLINNKIQTGLHYPRAIHLQPAYKYLNYKSGDLKNCEYNAKNCLSLPMYDGLTKKEVIYICNKIKLFFKKIF